MGLLSNSAVFAIQTYLCSVAICTFTSWGASCTRLHVMILAVGIIKCSNISKKKIIFDSNLSSCIVTEEIMDPNFQILLKPYNPIYISLCNLEH